MRMGLVTMTAAFGILALCAQSASAEIVDLGKHNAGEVKAACDKAGGDFQYVRTDSGYAHTCVKHNCDGNGGICQVYCDSNDKCTGATPGRVTQPPGKYDLVRILKFSPALPPRAGLLEPGQRGSPHGPSGLGAPKPATPPGGKLY